MGHCSLTSSLKIASSLAMCDQIIRNLERSEPLTPQAKQWLYDMFNMGLYTGLAGKIAWFLYKNDKEMGERLLILSRKIDKGEEPNSEEWELILGGMEDYRSYLIDKSHQCNCGCD